MDIKNIWDTSSANLANQLGYDLKPLWAVNFKDREAVLRWYHSSIEILKSISLDFTDRCLQNLMLYRGITDFDTIDPESPTKAFNKKNNNISVNLCYELTDVWVNRMSQYKAKISVVPKNNDSSSRQDAKMKQLAIDDSFSRNNIDFLLQKFQLYTRTMGEAYIVIDWNKDLGSVHPQILQAKKKNKKIYISAPSGEEIPLERVVKVGDVEYKLYEPYRILFPLDEWDKADYYCTIDFIEPEKLVTDYPDKEIKVTGNVIDNKIEVHTFYHPPTKYLPKGRYLKFINGLILENTEYPYSYPHKNAVRLTDIDIPNQSRAMSFLENIAPQQILTNMVMGANWRNISVSSFAKWVAPRGSVNFKNLGNQGNVVEYGGNVPPQLVKYQGLSPESFSFLEILESQARKQARLQDISSGTPPPNVRSGLQMAQLDEQQQRAVTFDITKRNLAIEQIANIALSHMADYYEEDDGRLLRIVGKDKGHLVKALKVDALRGEHIVEVRNNNGLPEGKFEKLSILQDMKQAFPNIVPDEFVVDAFDLNDMSRYTDYATAAIEKAESENEEMLDGRAAPEPEEYDDHIAEWKVHVAALRRRSFADATKEVKQLFQDHLLTTEFLMEQQAIKNLLFRQKLMTLDGYPIFYTPTSDLFLPPEAQPTPEGEMAPASMGEDLPQ